MTPISGSPDRKPNRLGCLGLGLALLLSVIALCWLYLGPHRRVAAQLLEEGARRGLLVESGKREAGPLSTTLHNVRVSVRTDPGLAIEIGSLSIRHWPFAPPQVSLEGIKVRLAGDPVAHLKAVAGAWYSPKTKLEVSPMGITYEHRLLGELRLDGVVLDRHGDSFAMQAAHAHLGDFDWQDVRLSFALHKSAAVIGLGGEDGQAFAQLTCFPVEGKGSRWLLDLPHGPMRAWLQRLGLDLGAEFTAARAAGSISLDIPDDQTQTMHGRMQMVLDDWPMFAPADAAPLLGRTFSLLSNLVVSADGLHWQLPRLELTMPTFSLEGQGSLQLGHDKRLVLDAEGERTCRQLRELLPPSRPRDEVLHFLGKTKSAVSSKDREPSARLEIHWDSKSPRGPLRPTWHFVPACGLGPWPESD